MCRLSMAGVAEERITGISSNLERITALAEAFGDRFEIDLGLARASDAVEQDGIEALADGRSEARRRLMLIVAEVGRRIFRIGAAEGPIGIDRDCLKCAGIDQPA